MCVQPATTASVGVDVAGTALASYLGVASMAACAQLCSADPLSTLAQLDTAGVCMLRYNVLRGIVGSMQANASVDSCVRQTPQVPQPILHRRMT